jgi:hypothetical protein
VARNSSTPATVLEILVGDKILDVSEAAKANLARRNQQK